MPKEAKAKTATKPSVAPPSASDVKQAKKKAANIDASLLVDDTKKFRGIGTIADFRGVA
jgi:hypothetical protein